MQRSGPTLTPTSDLVTISGVVERITFHSTETGYSVLKVASAHHPGEAITVVAHQIQVFAGATLEIHGQWVSHPQFGPQFKAIQIVEKKPATAAALEKYLGSGLIFGVGPKTAKKIVRHFQHQTLDVFENQIERLVEVSGIAQAKLQSISRAWHEHRSIRNVMLFLQEHEISTLFAIKIFKSYGERAIEVVRQNPYQLAKDIYGIGFFSADKIARSLGFSYDSEVRIGAAIKHTLTAAREEGHCYLTQTQIIDQVIPLIALPNEDMPKIEAALKTLVEQSEVMVREIIDDSDEANATSIRCYYAKSLYFDELTVAKKVRAFFARSIEIDPARVNSWLERYGKTCSIQLSKEQQDSILKIVSRPISILTGGPGCGKTTTTKTLVKLLLAMQKRVLLAAPTGRAAQRMMDVIGVEAKTIHRLLVWNGHSGQFNFNEENQLDTDFLILDECSMLDISLTAALFKAINSATTQLLLIGDPDQLPSVGAGNVLQDLIRSYRLPCCHLTQIFRQASESLIITYAHEINRGAIPKVDSPFHDPKGWSTRDCLFIDVEEMTQEQAQLVRRLNKLFTLLEQADQEGVVKREDRKGHGYWQQLKVDPQDEKLYICDENDLEIGKNEQYASTINIPQKYAHLDLQQLYEAPNDVAVLKTLLKKIHPWSALHYGFTSLEMLKKVYTESIPTHLGKNLEIQILTPMTRGNLGTIKLNQTIQQTINPYTPHKGQLTIGERIYREGDRVIQKRNNYDLGVFNGDIGQIRKVNALDLQCEIVFDLKSANPRSVCYTKDQLVELDLAYAITIHKSQGSEFDVVIIPVTTGHFKMLYRNLIYTGLTRAKKFALFLGTRKAFNLAIRNVNSVRRQTALRQLLK